MADRAGGLANYPGHSIPDGDEVGEWLEQKRPSQCHLGHMLATWPGRPAAIARTEIPGLPGPDELIERYAQQPGLDVADIEWFVVLACYRLGIILEVS